MIEEHHSWNHEKTIKSAVIKFQSSTYHLRIEPALIKSILDTENVDIFFTNTLGYYFDYISHHSRLFKLKKIYTPIKGLCKLNSKHIRICNLVINV